MISLTNSWLTPMDYSVVSSVLFLDLKKACDLVDHYILMKMFTQNKTKTHEAVEITDYIFV